MSLKGIWKILPAILCIIHCDQEYNDGEKTIKVHTDTTIRVTKNDTRDPLDDVLDALDAAIKQAVHIGLLTAEAGLELLQSMKSKADDIRKSETGKELGKAAMRFAVLCDKALAGSIKGAGELSAWVLSHFRDGYNAYPKSSS